MKQVKIRRKSKKQKEPVEDTKHVIDTIQEQMEAPMTTMSCPESVKEGDLKEVLKTPQNYIEINIVKKTRLVDSFYIPSDISKFKYKKITYKIIEEEIYILPTKSGFFMPTCYYYENLIEPVSFKQTNEGITGKALSLLYNENLYRDLFSSDETKYNLFIVILLIISIGCYLAGLAYLLGVEF